MELSNDNQIVHHMHCRQCIDELPSGHSPASWAKYTVGWTELGLQVWCERHECNVVNIDFEGHQHPADTTRKVKQTLKSVK